MITYDELLNIIEDALELPEGSIKNGIEDELAEKWDSLGHLSILIKLDQALDGRCNSITDLGNAYRIDTISDILKREGLMN
tara:strand:+ start:3764 stop:4006 length:243 start_codon:yes stop_codon:yes gene_type:complete